MRICAHVRFAGQCQEAVHFYARALGCDRPVVKSYAELGDAETEAKDAGRVAFAFLEIGGSRVVFTDVPSAMKKAGTTSQGVMLFLKSAKKLERILASLADGGKVLASTSKNHWNKPSGRVMDKYGVEWHLFVESQKMWRRQAADKW